MDCCRCRYTNQQPQTKSGWSMLKPFVIHSSSVTKFPRHCRAKLISNGFLGTLGVLALTISSWCSAEPAENLSDAENAAVIVSTECDPQAMTNTALASPAGSSKVESIRVGATGYGAPPPKYYPENQRRLMAMRASKIDAYRALAESINGLHIWGGTTIGDMVVQRDRYRVFVDAYVRGARIVSMTANDDGNYETVVELMVDDAFLNKVIADPTNPPCTPNGAHVSFAPPESPSTFYYSE